MSKGGGFSGTGGAQRRFLAGALWRYHQSRHLAQNRYDSFYKTGDRAVEGISGQSEKGKMQKHGMSRQTVHHHAKKGHCGLQGRVSHAGISPRVQQGHLPHPCARWAGVRAAPQ